MVTVVSLYKLDSGRWSLSDLDLTVIFNKIKDQNQVGTLFYDGSVLSAKAFIARMKSPGVRLFLAFVNRELAGLAFLTTFDQRTAQGHFISFKTTTKIDKVKAGRDFMQQLLHMKSHEDLYYFDTFYGIIPVNNKLAISYMEKVGMSKGCIIPKFCFNYYTQKPVDGQILYIVRGDDDESIQ